MVDRMTREQRSRCMSHIRARDTRPELAVRRVLHRMGFRFRLHRGTLPGRPDLVLPKWRRAVFVHGCFWHGHHGCGLFRWPGSNPDYWRAKISGNVERDRLAEGLLLASGWRVVTVWECSITGKRRMAPGDFADALAAAIRSDAPLVDIRG